MRAVLTVNVKKDGEEKTRNIAIETMLQVLILSIAETNVHSQTSGTDDRKKVRGHHIEKKVCRMRENTQNGGIRTGLNERKVTIEPEPRMEEEI